jgi:NitT/TauT family transport system substrate-binding protein
MLKQKAGLLGWVSTLAVAALVAGCGSNAGTGTADNAAGGNTTGNATSDAGGAPEVKSVTIGYLPNIVMPQPLLGINNGEFAKAVSGVTFAGKDFPAGPAVLEALRAGTVDIAYTGPYPPVKAYAKDKDVVMLAGTGAGGTQLMVAKDSTYKTVKDLKGKIIGVNQLGSTVDALVRYNVIQAGLTPNKDVKIIEVAPAEQAEVLKGGEVAAVAAPAPWPSVVEINGNGRALLDWKQILDDGNYLQGVVFTTKKFADANPNFVRQFVAAHKAITDRLNKDRTKGDAEVLAAWSKITKKKMEPEVAKVAFKTITYTNAADQKLFERDMDIAVQTGILKKKGDLTGFVYGG